MPPKSKIPKRSKALEKDVNEMEAVMKMLRSQIDEERAKVQAGPHWAAGAEGPIHKFDPHSKFARNLISKKKSGQNSKLDSSRSNRSEKAPSKAENIEKPVQPPPKEPNVPKDSVSPKTRKVEIIVEPQRGALWGHNMEVGIGADDDDENGGANGGGGGALWGPPPDEAEERKRFQEELNKIRGANAAADNQGGDAPAAQPKAENVSNKVDSSNAPANQDEDDDMPKPVPGGGGALWGPHPDEAKESEKFQRAVRRFRGEDVTEFPMPEETEMATSGVGSEGASHPAPLKPTGFTYFDMLVNKDIMDDTRFIDKK